ncbi:MAG: clostripain-related cysteine peptidase [Bacteriovoracia bacterium]
MKKLLLTFLLLTSHGVLAQTKSWTVLIYWAVDNDLYEFSIPYLEQFTRIPKSSNLNLVLEYDYPDNRPTERFHNFELIESIGERKSASPKTLTDFVEFGIENYPADNYMLIIASHGSNWSGVIDDTTSKSYMSLTSLRGALKRINSALPSWADICEEWRR